MRWLPRSLFGQVLLALLVGLLTAQAVGAWLMLDDRGRLARRLLGSYAAQRIAASVGLLDDADAAERARLVQALSVPPTRVSLEEPWQAMPPPASEEALMFERHLRQSLPPGRELQVFSRLRSPGSRLRPPATAEPGERASGGGEAPAGVRDAPAAPPQRRAVDEPLAGPTADGPRKARPGARRFSMLLVIAQVRLADGALATFRLGVPQSAADQPWRVLALVLVSGATVALLAGWTVRRLTRPLATLADAATGLARDLDRRPLPEGGPTEVARAARAFNAMQRALKLMLETRSQTLAAVSHDLRLPLTRARLRLEALGDSPLRRSLEADFEAMERMIADTLAFLRAGSDAEKPIRLDIDALIEAVVEDMAAIGAHVQVHGRAGAPLTARPDALRRCLANLLDNARSHGGGDIDVSVLDERGWVRIRVDDRGPGIPAAERERVFEPYVRLEPSRARHTGGAGLGLATARAVARVHGGEVVLSDRPGGGLRVELALPRHPVETRSAQAGSAAEAG